MSYCSALPVVESESNILIEACLAAVRQNAGLDDESVLPPLDDLLSPPLPLRLVAPPELQNLPSAEMIVRAAIPTVRTRSMTRTIARTIRWPVLLCGFMGGIFAGAGLMKSPAGEQPTLQHLAKAGRVQAVRAWSATRSIGQ